MIRAREGETWKAKLSSSCARDGLKYRAKPQSAPCSCLCLPVSPLPEVCGRPRDRSAREQEGCVPRAPLLPSCLFGLLVGLVFAALLLVFFCFNPASPVAVPSPCLLPMTRGPPPC